MQIVRHGTSVRLLTRRGKTGRAARYPWIVEGASALKADSFTQDCEAVVAGPDGVSVFGMLHSRIHDAEVHAFAFDLLELAGEDLRKGVRWKNGVRPWRGCVEPVEELRAAMAMIRGAVAAAGGEVLSKELSTGEQAEIPAKAIVSLRRDLDCASLS